MNYKDFSEILEDIKKIANSSSPQYKSFSDIDIFFNGKSLTIVCIKEINHYFGEDSATYSDLSLRVIYEQNLENSIFIEFSKFLSECKKRFGHSDKFDKLFKKLREKAEFVDVLESI